MSETERKLRELEDRNRRLVMQNIELQTKNRELQLTIDQIFKLSAKAA